MAIATRLTERLQIRHPVLSAPMALAAGGALAAAVSEAGGLGLIGGGYGDRDWLDTQFRAAGNQRVGCGFITWSLRQAPALMDEVLARQPAAVFLSFDDPAPFAVAVKATDTVLMCQVQTVRDAEIAIENGADILVAQGGEAGGHGEKRGTMPLVPEIADFLHRNAPDVLLCAAGGIADGRGLAAALMLGADGVVVGSRFWASEEALVHRRMQDAAVKATGDETVQTSVPDIVRGRNWPDRFRIRVLRNAFTSRWHDREEELKAHLDEEAPRFAASMASGDATVATAIVGEAVGLIHTIEPAGRILERMVSDAEDRLRSGAALVR